jgi:hypothetical protein
MLSDLYAKLQPDPWRIEQGFSAEMAGANDVLLKVTSDEERARILGGWLEKYQPCLFGKVAARKGLISYCFLSESDILQGDAKVRDRIQLARTNWTRLGFEGRRSAFVLVAISPRLTAAKPDKALEAFATHLASLYLLQEVVADEIYLDEIFLESPGRGRATWRWNVGVNYFASAGDQRWWQDHRIPGGIGFSANSVGHLVKAGHIAQKMTELEQLLELPSSELVATKIDSLPTALEWAMRTIHSAAEGPSGKATELLLLSTVDKESMPACPVHLPGFLEDRNYCEYQGYYHTDVTIPSEYFDEAVCRPDSQAPMRLDFTYLFDEKLKNPDFITTATGRRVRGVAAQSASNTKRSRATATAGNISDFPRLEAALQVPQIQHDSEGGLDGQ